VLVAILHFLELIQEQQIYVRVWLDILIQVHQMCYVQLAILLA